MIPLLIVVAVLSVIVFILWRRQAWLARDQFIRNASFPPGLLERLAKRRPELSLKDRVLVARALRQYFLVYHHAGYRFVSMPSQAADDLWHEFILYTRVYEEFCRKAFGRFFHHTPAVVLGPDRQGNAGLRRAWWYACKEENINPRNPTRLPLLFAIDAKLGIADGFRYTADCKKLKPGESGGAHCAGDFSSSSFDGGTEGFGDAGFSGEGGDGGGGDGTSRGGRDRRRLRRRFGRS
jgi:hypothetical protein